MILNTTYTLMTPKFTSISQTFSWPVQHLRLAVYRESIMNITPTGSRSPCSLQTATESSPCSSNPQLSKGTSVFPISQANILESFLAPLFFSYTSLAPSINSCWLSLQNICRTELFLTICPAITLVRAAIISCWRDNISLTVSILF